MRFYCICRISGLICFCKIMKINYYFVCRFYSEPNAQTSRRLFRYSLIYLPSLMLLMIIGNYERNKGLIERKKLAKIEAAQTATL